MEDTKIMKVSKLVAKLITNALYQYELMTAQQLASLLDYSIDYIYNNVNAMEKAGLIVSKQMSIYAPNSKVYLLSEQEKKTRLERESFKGTSPSTLNDQIRTILSNQFVCEGIFSCQDKEAEGFIEWVGPREAAMKYSSKEGEKFKTTLTPAAYLEFQNNRGRVNIVLETILDGLSKEAIIQKVNEYAHYLPQHYTDPSKVHLLFVLNDDKTLQIITEAWSRINDLSQQKNKLKMYATNFAHIAEKGFFGSCWIDAELNAYSIEDFFSQEAKDIEENRFLGKRRINEKNWLFKPLIPISPMVKAMRPKRRKADKAPKEFNNGLTTEIPESETDSTNENDESLFFN